MCPLENIFAKNLAVLLTTKCGNFVLSLNRKFTSVTLQFKYINIYVFVSTVYLYIKHLTRTDRT